MVIDKKNLFMYFVALVASLGGFQFGYEVGILESIKNFTAFKMDFTTLYDKKFIVEGEMLTLKYSEKNNIINYLLMSMFSIGCVIGTFIVPRTCDFFGRKRSILFGAAFFGFGSLFAGVVEGIPLFYFSRVIMGIGVGILSTVCPMYIAETAPAEKRGKLITLYQLMITVGILTAYIVRFFIENWLKNDSNVQWRVILGIQVVPGFLLLIMMFFLPYSPRYYIWQERDDEALRIVSKLRGMSSTRDPEIQTEFQNMKKSLEIERHEHSTGYSEIFTKEMLKRVLMVMGLQALQQLTGINIVLGSYTKFLLNTLENKKEILNHSKLLLKLFNDMTYNQTAYLSYLNVVVNVIGTLPTFWFIDKIGRKMILIVGSIGMTVSLTLLSVAATILDSNQNSELLIKIAIWASVICVLLFIFSFATSWGPVVWVYQSEAFPMRVRSKATSLCSFANWSLFALIDTFFLLITQNFEISLATSNLFLAFCCFISLFYTILFVRETKGIPLEEMDSAFIDVEKTKQK
jgi:MFS family permease